MIEVKNLTKRYGNHVAINDISFKLANGKIYGILGSYHSGKTTLLNMMTGCSSPSEGNVNINGFDISKDPIRTKKIIGFLPDPVPLYPEMTAFEFLSFVARAKGLAVDQAYRQIAEVFELVQLDDSRNKMIMNLPLQIKKRLGIAQALLGNPEIVFMDEHTSGLAPEDAGEMRNLIRKIGEFKTVILTSPDPSEIAGLCEQVLILNEGSLIANDTLDHLKSQTVPKFIITLSVKGDKETAISILDQIDEIQAFSDDPSQPARRGGCHFRLELKDESDPREKIVSNLIAGGCSVVSISLSDSFLDALFWELTQPNAEPAAQGGPEQEETEE